MNEHGFNDVTHDDSTRVSFADARERKSTAESEKEFDVLQHAREEQRKTFFEKFIHEVC